MSFELGSGAVALMAQFSASIDMASAHSADDRDLLPRARVLASDHPSEGVDRIEPGLPLADLTRQEPADLADRDEDRQRSGAHIDRHVAIADRHAPDQVLVSPGLALDDVEVGFGVDVKPGLGELRQRETVGLAELLTQGTDLFLKGDDLLRLALVALGQVSDGALGDIELFT